MKLKSIKAKVLLLLLSITAVVVIVMAVLLKFGFQQQFTQYKKSLENDLNQRLVVGLQDHYAQTLNWQTFVDDPRAWHELLFSSATTRREMAVEKPKKRAQQHPHRTRMKHKHMRKKAALARVLPSYSLFDQDQYLVVGSTSWGSKNSHKIPIKHAGQLVGYLVYSKNGQLHKKQDKDFNQTFIKLLVMITLVMMVVTLLFTLPVARYFTRPILALNRATKKAAAGDYTAKTTINRSDEFGQLGQNFNLLTSTLASNATLQEKQLADIAHDLRTPVSVIQAEIEAIQDGVHQANDKNLNRLHQQILSLGHLINDLQALSLSELGSMQYQMQPVALDDIVEQAVDAFKLPAEQKNLRLQTAKPAGFQWLVVGDQNRLLQLFNNLLHNAITYTDAGGVIEVELHEDSVANQWQVSISDSAPGLSPAEQAQMFDRLYRKEASRNKNTGGSGLGLAIARNIVQAHDGAIWAAASSLGGMCMTVGLPKHV